MHVSLYKDNKIVPIAVARLGQDIFSALKPAQSVIHSVIH